MTAPPLRRSFAALSLLALAVTGCAGPEASPTADADGGAHAQPIVIENCGSEVTLPEVPERIVLVNNDALANLEAFGAVDRIVAITSEPDPDLYSSATLAHLSALTPLSTETNSTGGSIVSQESILGVEPDLVIAPERAVERDALAAAGVAVYSPTAYCSDPPPAYTQTATFQRVWDELETFGTILGAPERAAALIDAGQQESAAGRGEDRGTAAAVYVSSGGAVLSPYGGPSMVTPLFEAVGLSNVYADQSERVFDVALEDLLARDPKTIVLLTSGDPDATREAFLSVPGIDALSAVQEGRVLTLAFPYTDPPSVLSARGPQVLADRLDALS